MCIYIYGGQKKVTDFSLSTFMWVLGIKFSPLELCGKHLNPLSHLISLF